MSSSAGGSTVGMPPANYDPYAFAGSQFAGADARMQIDGPQGELDDQTVPGSGETAFSAFRWLLAWAVLFFVLTLLNRTRFGHVLVYYGLALILTLLVVTSYGSYVWALAPFVGSAQNKAKSAAGQATAAASAENTNAGLTDGTTPTAWIVAQAQVAQAVMGGYPLPTGPGTGTARITPTQGNSYTVMGPGM